MLVVNPKPGSKQYEFEATTEFKYGALAIRADGSRYLNGDVWLAYQQQKINEDRVLTIIDTLL